MELRPDVIEAPGVIVQQPGAFWRVHGDFIPVRRWMEMEGPRSATRTGTLDWLQEVDSRVVLTLAVCVTKHFGLVR